MVEHPDDREWGEIFDDRTVAAAMLDRLLHRATVVAIDGESYRLRAHQARLDELRKGVTPVSGREDACRPPSRRVGTFDERPWEISPSAGSLRRNSMHIGLISDTHVPSHGKEPPPQVIEAFQGVDLILHAGDIYIQSCIEWLERIAPVEAATSGGGSSAADPRTGSTLVVEVEGHSIGLVHQLSLLPMPEHVSPGRIATDYPAGESLPAELESIFGKPVDIAVFGYTHEALVETHQGVLFVNPGSTTMVKQRVKLGTVAILELTPEGPEARTIELASFGE